MKTFNDYVLIEPDPELKDEESAFTMPSSAKFLHTATVIDPGPEDFVMHFMDGCMTNDEISKSRVFPGLEKGAKVMFRSVAEQRMTMDQAYRVNLGLDKDGRKRIGLLIKVCDLIALV